MVMSVSAVPTRKANTNTTNYPIHLSRINILSKVITGENSNAMDTIITTHATSLMSEVNLELDFF